MLALVFEWDRLSGPTWIGMDTATAFFPWYTFLGEQLRAGHIPVWNPHTFSGAPFAADPESGWMYLPAMLAFSLLPLDYAVKAQLIMLVLLAAIATYALARSLGANTIGAVLASTIYAHSGFFEGHVVCCYAYAGVAAWHPLALLGAERAMRSPSVSFRRRALWWGVAGLAFSQILAVWVGQGAYYATLVLGSFIAYRALTLPGLTVSARLARAAVNVAGVFVFGLALGAAGLLPRLEYNLVSNLRGGYPDADVSLRATSWSDWGFIAGWDRLLLQPGFEYIGSLALILPLAGLIVAWRRHAVPYFAVLGLAVLILARAEPTPLHAALSLLPGFEGIHARSPERALIVFYLAPALLAAASVTWLGTGDRWRALGQAAGALLVVGVALDLHAAWTAQAAQSLAGGGDYQFDRVDLATYFAPTDATRFLKAQPGGPLRYLGYAGHVHGGPTPYTLRWADPRITALEVNNRALLTGLEDPQGYNPVHVARYDALIGALNGHPQNYHHTDVFAEGLDSPLLDALNVRYVVMPTAPASDEVAPRFTRPLQRVYSNDSVQIFENPSAFPRAWLVHDSVQLSSEDAARALTEPGIDLRRTALLEAPSPPLSPAGTVDEDVTFTTRDADRLVTRVIAGAPGLVVFSEVAYPAWHAYLDGQGVPIYTVDVAFRGVAVPPGEHVIELRFESAALDVGLGITALALIALAILVIANRKRDGTGEVRCKAGAVPQL